MKELNCPSVSDVVYEQLFHMIASHQLKPGERLLEEQLSRNLGISRTPIRDAIRKLAKEGFAIMEPRKGAYVREFTLEDIIEVYDLRIALESLAIRLSINNIDQDELEKLRYDFSTFEQKTLIDADNELHYLIINNCRNKRLVEILDNLYCQSKLFRTSGYYSPERTQKASSQHIAIIDALRDRDTDRAIQLMMDHIEKSKNGVINEYQQLKDS